MILIGLLLVAAVCVVVGIALSSVAWLVASLVVSVFAGVLHFPGYVRGRTKPGDEAIEDATTVPAADATTAPAAAEVSAAAPREVAASGPTVVLSKTDAVAVAHPAQPAAARSGGADAAVSIESPANRTATVSADDAEPSAVIAQVAQVEESEDSDRMVLVVDGYPEFHAEGCVLLLSQDAVAIPHAQAVEDGFAPCGTCDPETVDTSGPQVWVADGFPEFHRENCARLAGHEGIGIPRGQAVADSFTACSVCAPDAAADPASDQTVSSAADGDGAAETPAAGRDTLREVWVVDGHPSYHRADCVELVGQAAEAIPHDQAVEDGFGECAVCTPEGSAPPAAPAEPVARQTSMSSAAADAAGESTAAATTQESDAPAAPGAADGAREVYVADGYPDFHVAGCPSTAALPALVPLTLDEAVEYGFTACAVCDPKAGPDLPDTAQGAYRVGDTVVVVDGFPNYHRPGCQEVAGLHEEPVPHDQAVEDGFRPCAVCDPEGTSSATSEPAGPVGAGGGDGRETVRLPKLAAVREVRVVDGQPSYHVPGCSELVGLDDEPVPYEQAVEDGFQPCQVCRPGDDAAAGGVREVLVVDGYPDYHLEGCAELAGLHTEPVPYEQAVEDGFAPCATCRPDGSAASPIIASVPGAESGSSEAKAEPVDAEPTADPPVDEAPTEAAPVEAAPVDIQPVEDEPAEPATAEAETVEPVEPAEPAEPVETAPAEQDPAAAEPADAEPVDTAPADVEPTEAEPVDAAPVDVVTEEPHTPEAEPAATPPAEAVTAPAAPDDAPAQEPAAPEVEHAVPDTATDAGTVWVVEGRPRYHADDCLIIRGQHAQPVTVEQAEQDGFRPCSLCRR